MARKAAGGATTKKRAQRRGASESAHNHHWLIESPNGPLSIGRCACGETREFRNSSEDSIWDRAEGRSRWNDMGISRRRRAAEDAN